MDSWRSVFEKISPGEFHVLELKANEAQDFPFSRKYRAKAAEHLKEIDVVTLRGLQVQVSQVS